jgi:hypothetical protein
MNIKRLLPNVEENMTANILANSLTPKLLVSNKKEEFYYTRSGKSHDAYCVDKYIKKFPPIVLKPI